MIYIYISRLVTQGCNQQDRIEYNETFSPAVKSTTIRVLLSLAVTNSCTIKRVDVSNALLHGCLNDNVCMFQPQGFTNPDFPFYVFHLKKSLYGLK